MQQLMKFFVASTVYIIIAMWIILTDRINSYVWQFLAIVKGI